MTEKEKMLSSKLYNPGDKELCTQRDLARNLSAEFNITRENEKPKRQLILKRLLGSIGSNVEMYPSIQFDYGCNTYIGNNVFVNFNCTILDCAKVTIGNNVFIGPNVSLLTPVHPLLASERNFHIDANGNPYMLETCRPITIESNVWLGGGVIVNPGVTIGSNSVIGSGSVVTKDIPSGVVAVGNPCRVLRPITESDRMFPQDLSL